MDSLGGVAALITASVGAISFLGGAIWGAWKWAKASARKDLLAEKAEDAAKADKDAIAELTAENARLWALLDQLTSPRGRS